MLGSCPECLVGITVNNCPGGISALLKLGLIYYDMFLRAFSSHLFLGFISQAEFILVLISTSCSLNMSSGGANITG